MSTLKKSQKILLPRERLEAFGVQNLSEHELIAILLRTGTASCNVLQLSKKVEKVLETNNGEPSLAQLCKIPGIQKSKATTILAALELRQRYSKTSDSHAYPIIDSPEKAYQHVHHLISKSKEHFAAMYLNARSEMIHFEVLTMGLVDASLIHAREVFAPAITHNAVYLILAHNHPSGDPTPSEEDIMVTKQLHDAGKILGFIILDHLIVAKNGWISLKEKHILDL